MKRISILVPCYNEEESIPYFYKELNRIEQLMKVDNGVEFEKIFVNDGSKDGTLNILKELSSSDSTVKYISFSRNFGKEAAIYAGLQNATGDYVVIMDADLQDPPALLPEMYHAIDSEGYDSVATRRVTRKGEPPIRSFFARMFYKIMNKISQTDLVDGARDYRLMNRKFVNALLQLEEYNRFSKGLFGWVGFKTKWIEFENVERIAGETKWSFYKLLIYAIEGIVAFSTMPLVIATVIGVICCVLALTGTGFIVLRKILFDDPVQGWASTVTLLLSIGGVQLLCAGILGQYIAKIYLEVKKRPIYIIAEKN
ncbi:MAG: glycosyltransferase family 2 protein [Phascolarctobacterium sp.]|nr:glycosyltransferase family 2 protein [Phascolarctobacterium sp.]